MPGNKNSGRKKKIVTVPEEEEEVPVVKKNVGGRPKKKVITNNNEEGNQFDSGGRSPEHSEDLHIRPKRTISHSVDLYKRNSAISNLYDEFLGTSLDVFPSSKLPLKRTILCRYRALRSSCHTTSQNEITETITKEILQLWDTSSIPHNTHRACTKTVKNLINMWVDASEGVRKSSLFQDDLNTLLDLRQPALKSLSTLKTHLKSTGNVNWKIDYDFFKGQCSFPQTSSISRTKDEVLQNELKEKTSKVVKSKLYANKNAGDFPSTSTSTTASSGKLISPSTSDVTEMNICTRSSRETAVSATNKTMKIFEDDADIGVPELNDVEWELPVREKRRLRKRPETITLTLPAQNLPSVLAKTSIVTKTSSRHELKIMSTLIKSGGGDINNTNLSVSTIQRQRRSEVSTTANEIRESIKQFAGIETGNDFVVIHFDGKIIQYMSGGTEDRLAICISVPNNIKGQFLASPGMLSGTGASMANCIHKTVGDLGLMPKVEALVFDTTASNTGKLKGSTTLFEKILGRAVLWLACRHHIPELFIKHANTTVRGESKGPEDPLFKTFGKKFGFINLDERNVWQWPGENDWRHQRASDVLEWAETHMRLKTWPREDYRELIELTVIFLGGVVKRTQYGSYNIIESPVRKPGACHRARFMASCLYLLKIYLYRSQFDELTPEQSSQVMIMAEYIALIHVPYFLKSPLGISAPRQDRDFWVDVLKYKSCFENDCVQFRMLSAVQDCFRNHLWYLTQELVIFGLFDKNLSNHERKAMAEQLRLHVRPATFPPGKPEFQRHLLTNNPSLDSFIGPKSWLMFHKLHADGLWLYTEPEEWDKVEEFNRMETLILDLKVVNDLAERCVKDVQEYKDMAKDSDYRDEILLVATDHRGVFQDLRKQALR